MNGLYYILLLLGITNTNSINSSISLSDKVSYKDAPINIVLKKNLYANSKRYQKIPQITSDTGTLPDVVVCTRTNEPMTIHTKWKCSCNTPFHTIRIQWEGYHSNKDTQFFLKDSFSAHLHQTIYKPTPKLSTLEWCKCVVQTCLTIICIIGIFIIISPMLEECLPLIGMLFGFGLLTALFSSSSDDDDDDWYIGDGYSSIR